MAKRKKDKNPPLIQLFTEFSFPASIGVARDESGVESFYKKIAKSFPRREEPVVQNFNMEMPSGAAQPTWHACGPPMQLYRFFSDDRKMQVQLSENRLEVKQLPPYDEWEGFEPIVMDCFSQYVRVWKPDLVDRAVICYLNMIDIPRLDFALDEYFNLFLVLPEFPKEPATNIALSYDAQGAQPGDIVTTTLRQYDSANPEGILFAIQWEYVATKGLLPAKQQLQAWLAKAHNFLSELFTSTFTDECRKLFN